MDQFSPFPRLPKDLRLLIWKFAASVPRIVEVHESHSLTQDAEDDPDDYDYYRRRVFLNYKAYSTSISSKTRPPALLSVCRESRTYGLSVYTAMDKGIRTTGSVFDVVFDVPIYVYPAVDVVFRLSGTCLMGAAFSVRCKHWIDHVQPLAATKTLAVDIAALSDMVPSRTERYLRTVYEGGVDSLLSEEVKRIKTITPEKDIAACAINGVRHIIFVVGNDEDAAECILEPLSHNIVSSTARGKKAVADVAALQSSLVKYWKGHDITLPHVPLPTLSLMAIKRKPLCTFPLFSKLPGEIQDMVWRQAAHKPRLITLSNTPDSAELYVPGVRQPALVYTCHASRRLFLSQKFESLHAVGKPASYRPERDTIRLEIWDGHVPKDFARNNNNIQSVGIPFAYALRRTASKFATDSKAFKNLREIVVLLGCRRAGYEMEMVAIPVDEDATSNLMSEEEEMEMRGVRFLVRGLRREVNGIARRWRGYQKERGKMGKVCLDYNVPTVRIARMVAVCENERPCVWEHRCSDLMLAR